MRQGFEGGHVHSRIRPLLGLRRADTEACCNGLGLQYVVDPSNKADGPWKTADGQALRRAALRERALPALAQALGLQALDALVSNWHGQGPVDLPAGQALREAKTGRMWLRATSER